MSALLLFLFLACLPTIVRAGNFAVTAAIWGGRGPAHLGHDGNDRGLPGGRRPQRAWIGRGGPLEAAPTPRNGYDKAAEVAALRATGVEVPSGQPEVAPIQPKAMPVILTTPAEVDRWLEGETSEASSLQRPLPDNTLRIIAKGEKDDAGS
jgi:hypothetical protein